MAAASADAGRKRACVTGASGRKRACVTGASGYVGGMLVKCLLEKGYAVNATVGDPANGKKVGHLLELHGLGDLKLFKADLTEDGSFEEAIRGCDFVFHVASPVVFYSDDPENDIINPAVKGVLNVLKSCAKLKTAKRVVYTSSMVAVSCNELTGTDLVFNEDIWSDVEYLNSKKPILWGYAVSKTLAEKMAFEFAKENNLDLISINPVVVAGESITQAVPASISFILSPLTGNEPMINALKFLQLDSGSISLVHVIDVCRAHIFVAENESVFGRYLCSACTVSVPELVKFLARRYPQYNVPTQSLPCDEASLSKNVMVLPAYFKAHQNSPTGAFALFSGLSLDKSFDDLPPKRKVSISSEKLIKAGFTYKYGIEAICDESVEHFKAVELLPI